MAGRGGTSWWGSHEPGPQQLVKEESVGVGLEDTERSGREPWSQAVGRNEASTVFGLEKAKLGDGRPEALAFPQVFGTNCALHCQVGSSSERACPDTPEAPSPVGK